ncbi:hypothetical protein [Marihabitans asiaticum]|uniref:hypothetical protein n=1 Tax=Marihabitans asiaticum TaxID=415218 RepID=UPI00319E85CC
MIDGLTPGRAHPVRGARRRRAGLARARLPYPAPVLTTIDEQRPLRLAFGSCRTSVPHDADGNATHGVDALRAYGLRMAGITHSEEGPDGADESDTRWPDMVLFLGDQVYADETSPAMREFIASRRSLDEAPWEELKDYRGVRPPLRPSPGATRRPAGCSRRCRA